MNKKLVGGIIAIIAIVALVVAVMVTRPKSSSDTNGSSDSSHSSKMSNSSSDTSSAEATQTNSVQIEGFAFSPTTIKVKKGTTVKWTNKDSTSHTVTGDSGGPDSELLGQGKTYEFTFNEAGTFAYHCKLHPSMTGTVIVE